MKRAIMVDAGISINWMWSVAQEIADGSLVRVLADYRIADGSVLWLVHPKSNVLSAKGCVFIDFLLEPAGAELAGFHQV